MNDRKDRNNGRRVSEKIDWITERMREKRGRKKDLEPLHKDGIYTN